MVINRGYFVVLILMLLLASCGMSDNDRIIGKWQCDQDWFEYKTDGTYDAGKVVLTMERGYKYKLNPEKKELIMYTKQSSETYYLQYEFRGDDTIALRNSMSSSKDYNVFYRVKKDK